MKPSCKWVFDLDELNKVEISTQYYIDQMFDDYIKIEMNLLYYKNDSRRILMYNYIIYSNRALKFYSENNMGRLVEDNIENAWYNSYLQKIIENECLE